MTHYCRYVYTDARKLWARVEVCRVLKLRRVAIIYKTDHRKIYYGHNKILFHSKNEIPFVKRQNLKKYFCG